jgi:DNA-binding NarL/FixJ family response regulator
VGEREDDRLVGRVKCEGPTPRELEVCDLIAEGLSNPDIATRLCVSRRTVSCHVTHILVKLNLSSRAQIAAWITRHHIEG